MLSLLYRKGHNHLTDAVYSLSTETSLVRLMKWERQNTECEKRMLREDITAEKREQRDDTKWNKQNGIQTIAHTTDS